MASLNISTQFTEDLLATTASPCEHPTCKVVIQPGEPHYYVTAVGASNIPGRFICSKCMEHYSGPQRCHATSARVTTTSVSGSNLPQTVPYGTTVDIESVRHLVNESQRKGHLTPQGRVVAMPPPQVPLSHASAAPYSTPTPSSGPIIHSAPFFQNYFGTPPQPSSASTSAPLVSGYSAAHAFYDQERERWAKMAYKGPSPKAGTGQIPLHAQPKKEVPIAIDVQYDILGNPKAQKTNIREGIPVDYNISSPELLKLAIQSVSRRLAQICPGFHWNFSTMTLREESTWQDVLQKDPLVPYFYGRYLKSKPGTKASAGGSTQYFSPPAKAVDFVLVIDREQWLASEQFKECTPEPEPVYNHHISQVSQRPATPETQVFSSSHKRKTPPSPVKLPPPEKKSSTHASLSTGTVKSQQSMHELSIEKSTSSTTTEDTDPLRNSDGYSVRRFKPIEASQVKKGIFLGGQVAIKDQKQQIDSKITETVACFTINPLPFTELAESTLSTNSLINTDNHSKYLGYLSYNLNNPKDFLGKGAFKTAHIASLKWISASPDGDVLGANMTYFSNPLQVAMKQPYFVTNRGLQKRYGYANESQRVLTEATLLGYAGSLLQYCYDFIDDFVTHTATSNPPFSIPRFRFVKGVVAFSEKPPQEGTLNGPLLSHCAAYLLEELIPNNTNFIKYIHNADATSLIDSIHPEYESLVFLCFIQHLQYIQTHGQAYISDFQGAGNLLTDPQIMTHPSLATNLEGISGSTSTSMDLFGEGNVDTAFEAFTLQHQCNRYCKWFKLEPFESTSDSEPALVEQD